MDSTNRVSKTLVVPALFEPLTSIQTAALDLYRRGLNVFPIPRRWEVEAWATERPAEREPYQSKPPFILRPFFITRLHLCGPDCKRRLKRTGQPCLPPEATFEELFAHANIAVLAGRTSENLVHVDCDSQKAFDTVGNEFEKRNLPFWAFTSHRGGGFLFRLVEGEAGNVTEDTGRFPKVGIRGNRLYAVLPPSVHPQGTVYQWVTPEPYRSLPIGEAPPLANLEALDWLGVRLAIEVRQKWEKPELYGLPEWTMLLSLPNRKILADVPTKGTRNTDLTKATYDVASHIISGAIEYREGLEVLQDAARRCDYPIDHVRQMLTSALKKNPTPARKSGGGYSLKPWQIAQAFRRAYHWNVYQGSGITPKTAEAVFFACEQRSRMENSVRFRASEREIAQHANNKRETTRKALKALSACYVVGRAVKPPPLLMSVGRDPLSGANKFEFTELVLNHKSPHESALGVSINPPLVVVSGYSMRVDNHDFPITPAEKDVFSKLGRVAWCGWLHLREIPEPSASAIARATGENPGSMRRALRRLQKFGLVTFGSTQGLYYGESRTEDELERLAAAIGTLGRSEKKKRNHRQERERRANRQLAKARRMWAKRWVEWKSSMQDEIDNSNKLGQ